MRIDFVVDAYSRNYPNKGEGRKAEQVSPAPPRSAAQPPKQRPVEQAPPQEAPHLDDESGAPASEEVLTVQEKQMLHQLFPPGLFGSGIRAYRNAADPVREVQSLGKTIDVRQ